MGTCPFHQAIARAMGPLEFAARDDFSHVGRVRDLEATVSRAAECAAQLAIPKDARDVLRRVCGELTGPEAGADRVRGLRDALDRMRPLAAGDFCQAALARPVTALSGVGDKRAAVLARRGLRTVEDVLFHLPVRYDDRRTLVTVAELEVGRSASFVARVIVADFVVRGRRRFYEALVGDETGTVSLKWFRGGETIARTVHKDARLLISGKVTRYRFSKQITHPEIDAVGAGSAGDEAGLRRIVPDYTAPDGLHPRAMRRLVENAVANFADLLAPWLPAAVAEARDLPEPADALRAIHAPDREADVAALAERTAPAFARLVLEELYLLEVGLALRRAGRERERGIQVTSDGPLSRAAPERLPFQLTGAQRRAADEILSDLSQPRPMHRLLEGDVGCGKTVVAFLAAVAVAESGYQTALLAPTELLAEQHERTLRRLADAAGLRVALLTASRTTADAERVRAGLAEGEIDLVVGTHALLQEGVSFHRLALVVIDEQHRFGVRQRAALAAKGADGRAPHILVMTATPIPRTLALTLHGDLDLSVIDELPPGRSPVRTLLFREGEGASVAQLLRETAQRGEQAYVVYPLVEESERIDLRSATESMSRIRAAFPDLAVDLVHGQQSAAERGAAMERFERGETQILVSTTVVEVGVDVANATLMIVEHAERFGLAQLHQLRGRVGRGERPGTCACVARGAGEESEARLRALLETTDGFAIAEADLRIRGPGEFLGTRQHGYFADLRLADLTRDLRWVSVARAAALACVRADPGLARSVGLARAVHARWAERLSLAEVG